MLTFFRKIRKGLLGTGTTRQTGSSQSEWASVQAGGRARKYMLYAVGEIALVVIGILIALQINNWNTYSNDRAQEQEYLMELRQDLISDTISLNRVLQQISIHINSATDVLNFIETGTIKDTTTLVKSIFYAGFMNFFNANLSTYNDLINSGNVRLIRDNALKRKLDEYVRYLQQIRERYDVNKKMVWFDYGGHYRSQYLDGRMGDLFTIDSTVIRQYPVDWKRMAKDQFLKNKLTWVIGMAHSENRWQLGTKQIVNEMINYLDELIEK